jgi:hypothetical protein
MVTKFNTSAPAGSSSISTSASGNTMRNIFIAGAVILAGYFVYTYLNRKKQETTVYVDESEEY